MTEQQTTCEVKPKKMGRPKKERKGERLWIPAEALDFVKSYLEVIKQKQPQTAETK